VGRAHRREGRTARHRHGERIDERERGDATVEPRGRDRHGGHPAHADEQRVRRVGWRGPAECGQRIVHVTGNARLERVLAPAPCVGERAIGRHRPAPAARIEQHDLILRATERDDEAVVARRLVANVGQDQHGQRRFMRRRIGVQRGADEGAVARADAHANAALLPQQLSLAFIGVLDVRLHLIRQVRAAAAARIELLQ
jgi:hypothetical protein